jgi:phage shock protein E
MTSLTAPELKKLISEDPQLVIIDIRTAGEVKEGHIPGAEWMDVYSTEFIPTFLALPKDKTYCLYCASGGRTSMAVPFLEEKGFKVCDLEGGIGAWIAAGNALDNKL